LDADHPSSGVPIPRRNTRRKLVELDAQLEAEPRRLREGYEIRADRVEVVGLLYLWPGSN
jgi:hypothetical protein